MWWSPLRAVKKVKSDESFYRTKADVLPEAKIEANILWAACYIQTPRILLSLMTMRQDVSRLLASFDYL